MLNSITYTCLPISRTTVYYPSELEIFGWILLPSVVRMLTAVAE